MVYALMSARTPKLFGGAGGVVFAGRSRRGPMRLSLACFLGLLCLILPVTAGAVEYDEAFKAYQTGNYEEALKAAEEITEKPHFDGRWWHLRLECLATLGRSKDGVEAVKAAIRQHYSDSGVRVAGYRILREVGQPLDARALLDELLRMAANSPWRFQSARDRVWLGRAAVLMGIDARQVLESFYDQAKKLDPALRDTYVATGDLALEKHDHAVAAETFREAIEKFPDDPDLLCGLALAVSEESRDESRKLLKQALSVNARHLPSLFAVAEDALSHEAFDDAKSALDKIHAVHADHPRGWALRAVLAHLQADSDGERTSRDKALASWKENPEVDHIIGAKLSSAYRFAEGSEHQRQALKFDAEYLPARTQLAQDLLRLGESDEGWKLVAAVHEADAYNVVAYNLVTLHDRIKEYTTLETDHFRLHMDRRESAVYGQRALDLLEQARKTLGEKYGWQPDGRVTVEILTNQKDFAVRTFGIPGGDGILGVCFGKVITVNSPAALPGQSTNWEATVWHEYCHVVTLELTKHRIPRWLSEGISVYEERQANKTWGNRLNRDMRAMILEGQMAKVGELNESFRNPKSGAHFNLAYYQASLVVEFFVDNFGLDALRGILKDIAGGMPINLSIGRRIGSFDELEGAFENYAREVATSYGEKIDWSEIKEAPIPQGSVAIAAWLKERPSHYLGRLRWAQALITERKLDEAAKVLESLVNDAPQWAGDDSPYALLAQVHREQKDTAAERKTLEASAARSDDALTTIRRLIELAAAERDEAAVKINFERYLAVQPLEELPYRLAGESGMRGGDVKLATSAARVLVTLAPADRAGAHFLLAQLLHKQQSPEAKRQVLMSLEETPRFRAAQKLLLEIAKPEAAKAPK